MKILAVIPCRIGSTRLPRKPLVKIAGKPLIQHVYEKVIKVKDIDKVIIATDSKEILNCVKNFNGNAVLTSKNHATGTDRVVEVVKKNREYDIILNIQGDEPLVTTKMIKALVKPFKEDPSIEMSTLKVKISRKDELNNPAIVKVVTDKFNHALYFSRSIIPYNRDKKDIIYYKHKGLYGFRRDFLLEYSEMEQTPLEIAESLEQLRVLENNKKIYVVEIDDDVPDVNTAEDIKKVEEEILKKTSAKNENN